MNCRPYAAAMLAALVFLGGCGAKQEVMENKVAVKVESVGTSNQLASGLYAGEVKGRKERASFPSEWPARFKNG